MSLAFNYTFYLKAIEQTGIDPVLASRWLGIFLATAIVLIFIGVGIVRRNLRAMYTGVIFCAVCTIFNVAVLLSRVNFTMGGLIESHASRHVIFTVLFWIVILLLFLCLTAIAACRRSLSRKFL